MHPLANRKTELVLPGGSKHRRLAALGWSVLIEHDNTVLMGSPT